MEPVHRLANELFEGPLRTATVLGLLSIPFTVVASAETGPESISFTPVLFAGIVVGYLYSTRPVPRERAGVRTGLVGGVPTLWQSAYVLETGLSWPLEHGVIALLFVPIGLVLGFGLSVLAGVLGAIIGDWLAGRVGRNPSSVPP